MTQCRTRETLKQQILDYIKANDGTNRLDLAAALHTDVSNISKVIRELIAEKKVFRSRGLKGFVCFHSSAKRRDIFTELNGKSNPGIVEEYCRNSLVYRFDKLLLAVRKNDSQPNAKSV
ncbi:hypothetical protein BK025_09155 [Sodalis sp. TME1]|nr:hypothetical protein BK025_09155 [Sodalis sp. TME1]